MFDFQGIRRLLRLIDQGVEEKMRRLAQAAKMKSAWFQLHREKNRLQNKKRENQHRRAQMRHTHQRRG